MNDIGDATLSAQYRFQSSIMRLIPTTGQKWLELALFPAKTFTALAYVSVLIAVKHAYPHAQPIEGVMWVALGLVLSFAILCLGGLFQKHIGPPGAYLVTCAFAVADLLFIYLLLPYMASA
jgi:hypothetical protein